LLRARSRKKRNVSRPIDDLIGDFASAMPAIHLRASAAF
jgi:hypothetical protein